MITHLLTQIYSLQFFCGAAIGIAGQRLYCRQKREWLDRHYPLPDGSKRAVEHLSRIWIAAAAAVLSLGYVLLTAQQTHDQTIALTKDVAKCWQQSYLNTKPQIRINAEN